MRSETGEWLKRLIDSQEIDEPGCSLILEGDKKCTTAHCQRDKQDSQVIVFLLFVKECLRVETPLQERYPESFFILVEGSLEPSA